MKYKEKIEKWNVIVDTTLCCKEGEGMTSFELIKEVTHGYLGTDIYEKLYLAVLNATEGDVIDIGPAQGASSISCALALQEKRSKSKVYSIDRFKQSAALESFDSIEQNVKRLRENLKRFNVEDYVEIVVADRDELPERECIGVIFIDADGAIDRDLKKYYNNLQEGGVIVVDDFERILNIQAKTRFLKWQRQEQINSYLRMLGISDLINYTPLGKQYTIYEIVNFLIEQQYIEAVEVLDGTLFARKTAKGLRYDDRTDMELFRIRESILKEYNWRHEKIVHEYAKLHDYLKRLAKCSSCERIFVFEKYFYSVKAENRFTKVYEWVRNTELFIEDDNVIQDIWYSDYAEMLDEVSKEGKFSANACQLQSERVRSFLEKEKIIGLSAYPMLKEENKIGSIVFLYSDENNRKEEKEKITNLIRTVTKELDDIQKITKKYLEI